jgi:hypothetical protein
MDGRVKPGHDEDCYRRLCSKADQPPGTSAGCLTAPPRLVLSLSKGEGRAMAGFRAALILRQAQDEERREYGYSAAASAA